MIKRQAIKCDQQAGYGDDAMMRWVSKEICTILSALLAIAVLAMFKLGVSREIRDATFVASCVLAVPAIWDTFSRPFRKPNG
jgi:hypothetical protein